MRAQTILFLLVDRVRGKLDCRPYRGGGEGNPKRLVVTVNRAFSNRSNIFTIRHRGQLVREDASPVLEVKPDERNALVESKPVGYAIGLLSPANVSFYLGGTFSWIETWMKPALRLAQ